MMQRKDQNVHSRFYHLPKASAEKLKEIPSAMLSRLYCAPWPQDSLSIHYAFFFFFLHVHLSAKNQLRQKDSYKFIGVIMHAGLMRGSIDDFGEG